MGEKKRTTIYVDTDLLRRVKLYCVATDTTFTDLVNDLLRRAIDGDQTQETQNQE